MAKIHELEQVALTVDIPEKGLLAGDTGTVVHIFTRDRGYAVEFSTFDGESVAIVNLPISSVRLPRHNEIPSLRRLELPSPAG